MNAGTERCRGEGCCYARTEANNMSKGVEDNGAEDRGDKAGDKDALNGGKGWEWLLPLMVLLGSHGVANL